MHHHPGSAAAPGWSTFFLAFCYQVVYFFSSVSFLSGLVFFKRRWSGFFPALAYFFLDVCIVWGLRVSESRKIKKKTIINNRASIASVLTTNNHNH